MAQTPLEASLSKPSGGCLQGHLLKVAVMLKVGAKTKLCGICNKNRPFGENVQFFKVTDIALD
jgi:hypothetical protein